jgi:hypothetical protein
MAPVTRLHWKQHAINALKLHPMRTIRIVLFTGEEQGDLESDKEARKSRKSRCGCFMGGTHQVKGGTGKAEDAKLQDAGIIPKECPRK